jgi:hypothetical protein
MDTIRIRRSLAGLCLGAALAAMPTASEAAQSPVTGHGVGIAHWNNSGCDQVFNTFYIGAPVGVGVAVVSGTVAAPLFVGFVQASGAACGAKSGPAFFGIFFPSLTRTYIGCQGARSYRYSGSTLKVTSSALTCDAYTPAYSRLTARGALTLVVVKGGIAMVIGTLG